jgi:crossover junction endodeoxyribonuclease RusA
MSKQITMTLPWPPSVNTYWRNVTIGKAARVLISKRGREYREACGHQVYTQRIPRGQLSGKLAVQIMAMPPDRRERDLDNLLKGLLDALKTSGVIRDDADIDDLHIRRGPVVKDGAVHLTLCEIDGEPTHSGELFAKAAA